MIVISLPGVIYVVKNCLEYLHLFEIYSITFVVAYLPNLNWHNKIVRIFMTINHELLLFLSQILLTSDNYK